MSDLIAELEAATEGSRELDASIRRDQFNDMLFCDFEDGSYHGACEPPGCGNPLGMFDERRSYPNDWQDDVRLPHYTTSIDAALTLAGNGWYAALLYALSRAAAYFVRFRDDDEHIKRKVVLWCCIAALKARQA